jgi:hypothetical protein
VPNCELNLSPEEAGNIISFAGYGDPDAPLWFIGINEALTKMTRGDAEYNLKARARFLPLMDLERAHAALMEGGKLMDVTRQQSFTQTWWWMARSALVFYEGNNGTNTDEARNYIQNELGRLNCKRKTFLTELFPIPSASVGDTTWESFVRKQCPDFDTKLAARNTALADKICAAKSRNALLVCYGSGRSKREQFASLLSVEWQPTVIAGVYTSSRCLLLPFFGQGRLSWSTFSQIVTSGLLRPQ